MKHPGLYYRAGQKCHQETCFARAKVNFFLRDVKVTDLQCKIFQIQQREFLFMRNTRYSFFCTVSDYPGVISSKQTVLPLQGRCCMQSSCTFTRLEYWIQTRTSGREVAVNNIKKTKI
uniref:Uncharacterized protein n=2 Tax=Micrurus TaxID=8634 RepID=A0A2D4H4F7_MICCO